MSDPAVVAGAVAVSAADTSIALGASVGSGTVDVAGASGTGVDTPMGTALCGAVDSLGVKIGELIDNFDLGKALWGTLSCSYAGLTACVGITLVVGVALLGSSIPILFLTCSKVLNNRLLAPRAPTPFASKVVSSRTTISSQVRPSKHCVYLWRRSPLNHAGISLSISGSKSSSRGEAMKVALSNPPVFNAALLRALGGGRKLLLRRALAG